MKESVIVIVILFAMAVAILAVLFICVFPVKTHPPSDGIMTQHDLVPGLDTGPYHSNSLNVIDTETPPRTQPSASRSSRSTRTRPRGTSSRVPDTIPSESRVEASPTSTTSTSRGQQQYESGMNAITQERYSEALRFLVNAGNYPPALRQLGMLLIEEEAIRDVGRGISKLKDAADFGDIPAMIYLGRYYISNNSPQKAVRCFARADAVNNSEGTLELARCYENGNGVERNIASAMRLYHKAADIQRNSVAMLELGRIYWYGNRGRLNDNEKGIQYFRMAGNNGNQDARAELLKNNIPP